MHVAPLLGSTDEAILAMREVGWSHSTRRALMLLSPAGIPETIAQIAIPAQNISIRDRLPAPP